MSDKIDRRGFLRSATAAGAGWVLGSTTLSRAQPAPSDQLNLALIGAGIQGQKLLSTCMKMGKQAGLRFRAVCDIYEDLNLARALSYLQRFGQQAQGFVDYWELLEHADQLDAVLIATPDFCHAEQTIAALNAGLHVYCEAPMSNSLRQARQMVQTAKACSKLLQIGYQRRSDPRYRHSYENLLRTCAICGKLTTVTAQYNCSVQPDRGWSRRYTIDPAVLSRYGYRSMYEFKNWMWYKKLGAGPAVDFGSHQLDVFNWFLGTMPKTITARGGTYYYDPKTHQYCDTVMAILEYELDGRTVPAFFQTVTTSGFGGRYEAFLGDQGTLRLSSSASLIGVYRDPQAPEWDKWVRLGLLTRPDPVEPEPRSESALDVRPTRPPIAYRLPVRLEQPEHQPHLQNFFDAVRGKTKLNCPATLAYVSTVTAMKITEAVENGRTIELSVQDFEL